MTLLSVLGLVVIGLLVAARGPRRGSAAAPRRSATIMVRLVGLVLAVGMGLLSLIGTAWILFAAYLASRFGDPPEMLPLLYLPFLGFCLMGVGIGIYRRSDRQTRKDTAKGPT